MDEDGHLDNGRRQAIARQLGYEETLFVDDEQTAKVSIFDLQKEIKFAGVPVMCAAWLLGRNKGESCKSRRNAALEPCAICERRGN